MADASLLVPEWTVPGNVRALVTTRLAGDMAAGPANVSGVSGSPRWLRQVHGTQVVDLDTTSADGTLPVGDAALTSTAGTLCVVRTADCLPVLLAAMDGSAVAAVHAGWRGLAAGVIENAVAALRMRSASGVDITAWLGPAIGPGHFEVGQEVRDAFLVADPGAAPAFQPGRDARWMCDLYTLARRRLAAAGIANVTGGGWCTYADETRFFSHRRDVQHRGLDATGRMASFIWRT